MSLHLYCDICFPFIVLVNTLLNVIVKVNMRNIVVSMYSLRTQKRKFGINSGNANIFISSCNSQL